MNGVTVVVAAAMLPRLSAAALAYSAGFALVAAVVVAPGAVAPRYSADR
ncbi:hypothetical protein [Amycolatopsis sp. 3B14]